MPDGELGRAVQDFAPNSPSRPKPKKHWFSDLALSSKGLVDRRTGRTIDANQIKPAELFKFLGYFAIVLVQGAMRCRNRPGLSVWFTPERPPPWYVVWSAMVLSGLRFARGASDASVVFYFEDKTVGAAPGRGRQVVLNSGCADIRKTRVAQVFERAAGYPLALDPMLHIGTAVEKSEENGAHDGRLVHCPMPPAPAKCYQYFIDCSDGTDAFDFRVTVIARKARFVLVKRKCAADRFSIHNAAVTYRETGEVFTPEESALLNRFAAEMELDWAAIDVLRDRVTRRIYIVDVNKTDTGPAVDLSWRDRERVKRAIAEALLAMVRDSAARA